MKVFYGFFPLYGDLSFRIYAGYLHTLVAAIDVNLYYIDFLKILPLPLTPSTHFDNGFNHHISTIFDEFPFPEAKSFVKGPPLILGTDLELELRFSQTPEIF